MEKFIFSYTWNNKEEIRRRISSKGWDYINFKVHEAIHVYGFENFCIKVLEIPVMQGMSNPYRWANNSFVLSWHQKRINQHRQPSHYIKKDHHTKKELSQHDRAKQEWREKKGINKDKQKNGWRRRNAGRHYKKISNRMHRRWQKDNIHYETFEDIGDNDYKFFQDPWIWD